MYFFILMPASGYAYFSPIILRGWNYSRNISVSNDLDIS